MGREFGIAGRLVLRRRDRGTRCAVRFIAPVRMGAGVDFPQGVDVDVGVDLGGFHAGVAEHFLHIADVGSATVHVGGTGVAEKVAGAGFIDAAAFHEFLDPVAEIRGGDAGAVAAGHLRLEICLATATENRTTDGREWTQIRIIRLPICRRCRRLSIPSA